MTFQRGKAKEDWITTVLFHCIKVERKDNLKTIKGLNLSSMVGKIYAGVLVDRVNGEQVVSE